MYSCILDHACHVTSGLTVLLEPKVPAYSYCSQVRSLLHFYICFREGQLLPIWERQNTWGSWVIPEIFHYNSYGCEMSWTTSLKT